MTATRIRARNTPLLAPTATAGAASTVLLLAGRYLDTPWKAAGNREWALTTDQYGGGAL